MFRTYDDIFYIFIIIFLYFYTIISSSYVIVYLLFRLQHVYVCQNVKYQSNTRLTSPMNESFRDNVDQLRKLKCKKKNENYKYCFLTFSSKRTIINAISL